MENEPFEPSDPVDEVSPDEVSPDEPLDVPPPPPAPTVGSVPPPPPSATWPVAAAAASDATRRNWGAAAHASAIVSVFLGGLAVLGPLVVWLVKKDEDPWVSEHAREALNFQLTWLIGSFIGIFAVFVLAVVTLGLGLIVIVPAVVGLLIAWLVFTVKGALAASRGDTYRYPMSIRMVS